MKASKGHYHDAMFNKRTRVTAFLVEATGGVASRGRQQMYALERRTKGRGGIDRTKYGRAGGSPTSFLVHHLQQISKAAVMYDAMAIRKAIRNEKQRTITAAQAVPAGGVRA